MFFSCSIFRLSSHQLYKDLGRHRPRRPALQPSSGTPPHRPELGAAYCPLPAPPRLSNGPPLSSPAHVAAPGRPPRPPHAVPPSSLRSSRGGAGPHGPGGGGASAAVERLTTLSRRRLARGIYLGPSRRRRPARAAPSPVLSRGRPQRSVAAGGRAPAVRGRAGG